MLSGRSKKKFFNSYQPPPLELATLHIDQGTHAHILAALFLFTQSLTQHSAALLGIDLTYIYAPFKLTHSLAACDWAMLRMMKMKWTILSLSCSDLHSNSILPSLSPTVTHHNTQIFPECHCSTCIEVELRWHRRTEKFRQEGLLNTRLNGL